VPLIAVAELCYWYSVLTTANVGQVFEAIIWGAAAALTVIGMWSVRAHYRGALHRMILAWCAVGVGYVAFMFLYDLPMYWTRWLADHLHGRVYLGLMQGLLDALHRRVVSYRWQDWEGEMLWMSLYFSIGVWVSLSTVYAAARAGEGAVTGRRP
jgi:hypothetical protein